MAASTTMGPSGDAVRTPEPRYDDVVAAGRRISGHVLRSPLVPLSERSTTVGGLARPGYKIWLKLESLQPSGSFKWRGAWNALLCRSLEAVRASGGVCTASAGNFGRALALASRELSVPCTVVVPEHAPAAKTEPMAEAGARVVRVPYDEWWKAITERCYPGVAGEFIHPVSPEVISGNGTIGLEVYEDLPEVDAIIVPYGGGGLAVGTALALHELKPSVKVFASEVASAAPLKTALQAGEPTSCSYSASFVDGIGSRSVLANMWPLVRRLVSDSIVVGIDQVASAVRLLATGNGAVTEGAGASSVAAALAGIPEQQQQQQVKHVVCIVSGSNIDGDKLAAILQGQLP